MTEMIVLFIIMLLVGLYLHVASHVASGKPWDRLFWERLFFLIVGPVLSPTRLLIHGFKEKSPDSNSAASLLQNWNVGCFCVECGVCLFLLFYSQVLPDFPMLILLWLAFSRCNEIATSFYGDAKDRIGQLKPRTSLSAAQRIPMAIRSYLGLTMNFGIIYYSLQMLSLQMLYECKLQNFVDVLYFSGVTITTLGYGDIHPTHIISKLLSVYEVFSGILLIVLSLGIYLANSNAIPHSSYAISRRLGKDVALPTLNHSYICFQLLRQLIQNENTYSLPELTLDIENGLTPDISVFPKDRIHPDFFNDTMKFQQTPLLAIEVISPSQNIQAMLEKARMLVKAGVHTVWTVEPFSRSVFVTTPEGEKLFHDGLVENEDIQVDFSKVFSAA